MSTRCSPRRLLALSGKPTAHMATGHVRYTTSGSRVRANAQPMIVRHGWGTMALCHNGNLTNALELRRQLENEGPSSMAPLIEGQSVHEARKQAGCFPAQSTFVECRCVIGVPDSGLTPPSATRRESGIPYGIGFIKIIVTLAALIQGSQKQARTASASSSTR